MDDSCIKKVDMLLGRNRADTHEGWTGGHEALVTKMKRTVCSLQKASKDSLRQGRVTSPGGRKKPLNFRVLDSFLEPS